MVQETCVLEAPTTMTGEIEEVDTMITATMIETDIKGVTEVIDTSTREAEAAIIRRKRGGDLIVQGKLTKSAIFLWVKVL